MKLLIIVPAFNEASVIKSTIRKLRLETQSLQPEIVVVDDGSVDDTAEQAKQTGVKILHHVLNRGLGGAIGTGLAYARLRGFDVAVTFDADGQHDPKDVHTVLKPIIQGKADIVIGSRYFGAKTDMPFDRRLILNASNVLTYLLFGQTTSDSLSGFRAFGPTAVAKISIKTERMEVSNEIFSEIRRLKLRLKEVPIKVIYTEYSRRKGQSNTNALNIIMKLFIRLFR